MYSDEALPRRRELLLCRVKSGAGAVTGPGTGGRRWREVEKEVLSTYIKGLRERPSHFVSSSEGKV